MKRLLAYLFIVLGLGILVNINNLASANILLNTVWEIKEQNNYIIFLKNNNCLYTNDVNFFINQGSYEKTSCHYFKTKGKNKFILKYGIDKYEIKVKKNKFKGKVYSIYGSGYRSIKAELQNTPYNLISKIVKIDKTQTDLNNIAKLIDKAKEESQSVGEQVVKTSNKPSLTLAEEDELKAQIFGCWSIPLGLPANENLLVRIKLELKPDGSVAKTEILDHARMNQPGQGFYKVLAESALRAVKLCQPLKVPSSDYERWKTLRLNFDAREMLDGGFSSDTQIAKAEPSQTQEETQGFASYGGDDKLKKLAFCIDANHDNTYQYSLPYINGLGCGDGNISTNYKDYIKKNIEYFKSRKKQFKQTDQELYNIAVTKLKKEFKKYGIKNDILISVLNNEEPKITPNKKVKVVKKEPKQEEFKPKKTNQDNEAPVIEIAEAITVNDSDYEFEGTVTDKSKQIFIEVDGRLVDVKKGKFTVKGYSPVDKEISIQAIDGYGNRSKPKIVKLIIDIKDTDIAEKLEPLNPSKIRAKISKNKVALIIGIENYIEAPNANYANLDAKYFFDYARKGFGIKKQNINLLVDENATFVKTSKALTLWLKTKIKADQTDLVVFFAGHGLASSDGKELYLLPQDSDPNLLNITALSRTKLFQTIIDLKPKSVTMFLDTCYSGVSRDEQMLLASARPIRIVADEQEGIPENFTIFTASQVEQISSGLKEANHGIFSYYLMKGMEGNADINKDKKITNGELLAYMDENVSQKAAEQGRQQNPSLAGDPNKVLMTYR